MELFTILATCSALTFGTGSPVEQAYPYTKEECQQAASEYKGMLTKVKLNEVDRDAISRVAFAEAANQGDAGIAGVVYTIINRFVSGNFGASISDVVNAPRQFEPVSKVGGNWKKLPEVNTAQRSKVDTIINLALDGHLPDLTNGALFFQNPKIVADREKKGTVSKGLTNFGGSEPSAVINDHAFFAAVSNAAPVTVQANKAADIPEPKKWDVFGNSRKSMTDNNAAWDVFGGKSTGNKSVFEGEQ